MDMTYTPNPLNTSGIHLSESINEIIELLAKNTHDNWAAKRISEGWRYGSRRDEIRKEHPCLVEYEELPESEKELDRIAVREVIRTILILGYQIEKKRE